MREFLKPVTDPVESTKNLNAMSKISELISNRRNALNRVRNWKIRAKLQRRGSLAANLANRQTKSAWSNSTIWEFPTPLLPVTSTTS